MGEVTSAFVALGSNVGERLEHLRAAVVALDASAGVRFVRSSAVYETEPVGPPQRDFLNAVVEIHTDLEPLRLLACLKGIERERGRMAGERWGPREVDLDLLLYGEQELDLPEMRVPHPGTAERAFVLVPLCDIAPFARIPGAGLATQVLDAVGRAGVRYAHRPEALWPERIRQA